MGIIASYQYYRDLIIFTQRGNYRGRLFSNAKLVFVVSLIEAIEKKIFVDNRLLWGNREFKEIYYQYSKVYHNRTRIILPFFHLDTSEYFHVKCVKNIMAQVMYQAISLYETMSNMLTWTMLCGTCFRIRIFVN